VKPYERLADVPDTPGKHIARVPVTVDLNGAQISIWTHVLIGARPGPTLLLLSGSHGNEWGHLEFFHRFVTEFRPGDVAGRVLVVPVANSLALGALSRAVPDDSDQPDVNRSFPGEGRRFTWLAEQIATTLADEVMPQADAVLEFHVGIWGSALGSSIVGSDYTDAGMRRQCLDLALVFGTPLIFATRAVTGFPGPRSLLGYAGEKAAIPTSGSMLGGAGFERGLEQQWQAANGRGIRNVMTYMGMLDGDVTLHESYLIYETVQRVNPRNGGLLLPAKPVEEFGREVSAGEVLGRVVSPYSLEVMETLAAPMDGYLAYWARDYPVRPGDWAFGVIPKEHAGTKWMTPSQDERPRWGR
jgi:predicted deacylase